MKIETRSQGGMAKFHDNSDIDKLVDLFLTKGSERFLKDLLAFFQFDSKKQAKVEQGFAILDKIYSRNLKTKERICYDSMKKYLLNIYKSKDADNLRGAFLEVLIMRNARKKYSPEECHNNCFIIIDEWKSHKTVDVFILCEKQEGIIYECKISVGDFDKSVISNLKEINNKSDNNFQAFFVTLSTKVI